ncbi:MAG: hypothetical protein IJV34_01110 [Prevotella sp.]|nr:hypothetical protein [Prevotella sp.]
MFKKIMIIVALCASLTAWAIEIPKAGPQYMPEVMETIVAPFDVSGIHMPTFAASTATVKMAKKGLSTKPISERICDGQQGWPVLLPMMVAPVNCKNILIESITIDQGLFWNIVPQYCDNVIICGVTVNSAGHGQRRRLQERDAPRCRLLRQTAEAEHQEHHALRVGEKVM